jgi:hypothetical protein
MSAALTDSATHRPPGMVIAPSGSLITSQARIFLFFPYFSNKGLSAFSKKSVAC